MTAPTDVLRRAVLLAALLLAAVGLSASLAGSAKAAQVEHHQVVAGLQSAKVEARVDPEGVATGCQAEFVSEAEFESSGWGAAESVPCEPRDLGAGSEAVATEARTEGLALSTAYRYRLLLTAGATTPGAEGQFSTFGFESFSFRSLDSGGEPETQAGATPHELIVEIASSSTEVETPGGPRPSASGTIKTLLSELPPGLIGNPTAVPGCPVRMAEEQLCSGDTQVGMLEVISSGGHETRQSRLYNTIPPDGTAARFTGFINASTSGFIDSGVRTGDDYGITAGGFNISDRTHVYSITVRLWGVPADPSHDAERRCPIPGGNGFEECASTLPRRPFLRNPTSCAGPLAVRARMEAYQGPGHFYAAQDMLPAITGCEVLEFDPAIEVSPTSVVADSPTGLEVSLEVPQHEDPDLPATADLRNAVVKLPPGFTVNPSSANGLAACTPAQFGLTTPVGVAPIRTTAASAACPDAAKIGTVEVNTPLLDHPLPGAVYVAEPYQNPFGSLLAIYIAVHDPISGVVIKLAGRVDIGPGGQLTTTFSENPQLPFESFKLRFFGGDLATLKTPDVCGTYQTTSTLTPWSAPASGPPVNLVDSHAITQGANGGACPPSAADQPNAPGFEAGSESPLAGAFSPFLVRLSRPDGSQRFSALTITPPPGLLGRLAGLPYCPEAALAAASARSGAEESQSPSCPLASRVGSVLVGAGAGPKPYHVTGAAYLAGPYKGAPFSLAVLTPALAGPYDLGVVLVRAAVELDPVSAQVTVRSDPIPTELEGIPLGIRSLAVRIDRDSFTLNPTSCEEMAVGGSLATVLGMTASLADRFQVGGCRALGFKPRVGVRLFGGITRAKYQGVRAVVRPRPGDANIAGATVRFPSSAFIAQEHLQNICTRVKWAADACPSNSVYGRAIAYSPLFDGPLRGNLHLRSSNNPLPDLVADLRGPAHQPIRVEVAVKTDSLKGALRATVQSAPDAPVSFFRMQVFGGQKGLIVNSRNICKGRNLARAALRAHNGRRSVQAVPVRNARCGKWRKAVKLKEKRQGHGEGRRGPQ